TSTPEGAAFPEVTSNALPNFPAESSTVLAVAIKPLPELSGVVSTAMPFAPSISSRCQRPTRLASAAVECGDAGAPAASRPAPSATAISRSVSGDLAIADPALELRRVLLELGDRLRLTDLRRRRPEEAAARSENAAALDHDRPHDLVLPDHERRPRTPHAVRVLVVRPV